jgi:hypothetical protein
MENQQPRPAVERPYEDPPRAEQRMANVGITAIIALVTAVFVVAIVAFVIFS